MVTLGVRVRDRVSVRIGTAFVVTLVPGSGFAVPVRICLTFKVGVRVRVSVRAKCCGYD